MAIARQTTWIELRSILIGMGMEMVIVVIRLVVMMIIMLIIVLT